MGAPKLKPGTPMQTRTGAHGDKEAKTPPSHWHRVRWWLHHHLNREDNGEWLDMTGWGSSRGHVGARRARGLSRRELREDMRIAQHAQDVRAESVTLGGREETQRFYGRGEFAGRGEVGGIERTERRLNVSDAEKDRARYEAEQKAAYEQRRRRQPVFRLPWE